MSRTTRAAVAIVAAAVALPVITLPVLALPASAHVTVKPESTVTGSFSQLVFRTPNESDDASTVKMKVTLPIEHPLLYVSVLPVPGWKAEVTNAKLDTPVESYGTKITEAPSAVTWTATGGGVKPGEYQNFAISAGPLPDPSTMVFPAVQTYSDGEVVTWDEVQKAGEDEPEHPAPTFTVTATTAEHAAQEAAEKAAVQSEDDNGSTTLAVAGLVVAVIALLLALVAVLRGRRTQEV